MYKNLLHYSTVILTLNGRYNNKNVIFEMSKNNILFHDITSNSS